MLIKCQRVPGPCFVIWLGAVVALGFHGLDRFRRC